MDKKYSHCTDCEKKFKKKDEVVQTDASGEKVIVHIDCLYAWLIRWSTQEYFDTHEDMILELGIDETD